MQKKENHQSEHLNNHKTQLGIMGSLDIKNKRGALKPICKKSFSHSYSHAIKILRHFTQKHLKYAYQQNETTIQRSKPLARKEDPDSRRFRINR